MLDIPNIYTQRGENMINVLLTQADPELTTAQAGLLAGIGGAYIVVFLVIYILLIVAWWKMFEKAGEAGWKSLIPIYSEYILFKIAWGNGWFFLLLLVPVVSFVVTIIMNVKLSKAFGYGTGFAIGLIFLPNIFMLILGFGSSEYVGVQ